jgi:hypothetical protein
VEFFALFSAGDFSVLRVRLHVYDFPYLSVSDLLQIGWGSDSLNDKNIERLNIGYDCPYELPYESAYDLVHTLEPKTGKSDISRKR